VSWFGDIGRMLGLGSSAGFRPSLTLAIIAVMSNLGWGATVDEPFGFLNHWVTVVIFVLFAIFESAFDKVPTVDRLQDRLTMPYRLVCGAVAGAALVGHGTTGVVVGLLVGAAAAWMAARAKREARPRSASSDAVVPLLSLRDDLLVFGGVGLTVVYAWVGYIVFAIALVMLARHLLAERRKYRRLRAHGV
jgi:uncharacterized membrane protein